MIPDNGNITVANDDAYYGFPDMDITGNVSDNDTDPEGDAQTVNTTPVSGPSNGSVVLNADGSFVYTPNPGYSGTDQFVYEVCDDGTPQACDQATVYISIDPNGGGNEILAIDDINDTFVNMAVDGDVSTNDENADGPAGTEVFTLVTPPVNGSVVLNADGTYTYTPNTDYVGEDTFEYQVCDGGNPIACDTAIVYIEIQPVGSPDNDPPVANADTNTTEVDTPVDGTVLPNDFDPDGDPIVVTGNTQPANGSVVMNPDGTYTYTPNPGFEGEDTFEYTICDDGTPALCDTATVTIQVIPDNGNITVANDDAYYGEINEDITGNVMDNDTDPEGDAQTVNVTISPISGPTNGTVVFDASGDGTFTYTPGPDFTGTDQFVYGIFDDGAPVATDVATVYILINQTPAPAIAIVKTGVFNDLNQDMCANVDETITYTFTVTNQGNEPLGNVIVTDPLLEAPNPVVPIVFVSGDDNGNMLLDVDETWIYTADYVITQIDIDAGEVVNQATAEGTDEDGTTVSDLSDFEDVAQDRPTVTDLCQYAAIAIIKEGVFNDENGDGCSDVDETITYTFRVANPGNVSLSAIDVTDPLLQAPNPVVPIVFVSGDTDNDSLLDTDEIWIYTATSYAITQDDIDAGEVENQATVVGTDPNGDVQTDLSHPTNYAADAPTIVELCQDGAIAIIKTGEFNDENGDGCSDVDETITYTFTVTNQGNVSLSAIDVTDPLLQAPNPVVPIVFVSGDTDNDSLLDTDEIWIYTATSYAITQDDIDAGEVENQATVVGTDPNGDVQTDLSHPTNYAADAPTIVELCQDGAIAIIKTGEFNDENGDGCSDVDETITYTFTVTNQGNVSLGSIAVTDPLLQAPNPVVPIVFVSGDTNNNTLLDVDETWIYNADYAITQGDIDAGEVVNQATAEGTEPDGTVVSDLSDFEDVAQDRPTVTDLCQYAAIAIIKEGVFNDENGDGCSDVDETITYTFRVANPGNVSLSAIDVTDPLLQAPNPVVPIVFVSGDTNNNTLLDVDETWIYNADYAITQGDIDAGEVVNQATAEGTEPDGTVVSDLSDFEDVTMDRPTVTDLCQDGAIAIIKEGVFNDENGDMCSNVDETITYTFTVTNQGNVSLGSIAVTDPLLQAPNPVVPIVFVSGDTNNNTLLDVDETWIYNADYAITQGDIDAGEVVNQATAEGTEPDGTVVSDLSDFEDVTMDRPTVTDLCQDGAIALVKTGEVIQDGGGCPTVGDIITYTFIVTNEGNVNLDTITVTDPLLEAPNPVVPIAFVTGDTNGDGLLNIDEAWMYTADYVITQDDVDAGEVVNQATATGVDPAGNTASDLSDFEDVTMDRPTIVDICQSPFLGLVKSGVVNDLNGNGCADVEETITYTFTVYNEGNVTITNIDIEDPMVNVVGGPIDLAPLTQDGTTFTAVYSITQTDIDNGFVSNQATARGLLPDGSDITDLSHPTSQFLDEPTVTQLCQIMSMSVEKTGVFNDDNGDLIPQVGETISYTFRVENTGSTTIYNITLVDPLPGIIIDGGPIAVLEPGEIDEDTFTGTYAITQEDIEAGMVINQATATGEDINGIIVTDDSDDPNDPTNVDNNGDGEPDDPTVTIIPNVDPEIPFEIYNGVTPNGDGAHDYFQILGIEEYQNNTMQIFNRWGVLVYETEGYGGSSGSENVFTGISEGRVTINEDKYLPTGTYYYILKFPEENPGQSSYAGYLYLNR